MKIVPLMALAPTTFAGWHTRNNSPMMPGMGLDRDKNTYYWPEYQYVANGEWEFRNYDMNGSYLVPDVDAFDPAPESPYSGVAANFL